MLLTHLLALGATLLTPILALPVPEAPANSCNFHAEVQQHCNHGSAYTSLTIPQIFVGGTTKVVKPNGGKRTSLSKPWHVGGLVEDLVVEWGSGGVNYQYGDETWDGVKGDGFECAVGKWSDGELDCNYSGSRTQSMDCTFDCAAAPPETDLPFTILPVSPPSAPALSARSTPFDFSMDSTSITQVPGTDLAPTNATGWCRFDLQLMEQCLHNPTESWHPEMLGNLFSIRDAGGMTAVTFHEGAGRIDNRAKRMTGFGREGLILAYMPSDGKAYFKFDGRIWDTSSEDKGAEKTPGLCSEAVWSRERFECRPERGGDRRVLNVNCLFQC